MLTPLPDTLLPLANTAKRNVSHGAYADAVLSTSPLGYWPLWETTGVNAADLTSAGRNGAYTVAALAERALPGPSMGRAPLFQRTHTVTLPGLPGFANSSFTIAAWAYASTTLEAIQRNIFTIYENGNANKSLQLYGFTTSLRINDGATLTNLVNQVTSGAWAHYLWVYDQPTDTSAVYKNNTAIGAGNTGPFTGTTPVCAISALAPYVGWEGNIGHVACWLRALNAAERALVAGAA